jgi:hypothetical protein
MNASLIQHIQTLYHQWISLGQEGTLTLSMWKLEWTKEDLITINLNDIIGFPKRPHIDALIDQLKVKDPTKRLKAYYTIGEYLSMQNLEEVQKLKLKPSLTRAANRTYEFFQMVGEEHMSKDKTITASRLTRLPQAKYEDLMHETYLKVSLGRTRE